MNRGRYGVAKDFYAPVLKAASDNGAVAADWTPGAGDVKLIKDGTDGGNVATLPSFVTGRKTMKWPLSASEMEAKQIMIEASDAAIQDQFLSIETLPEGALATGKCQAGSTASVAVLAAAEDFSADDRIVGSLLEIHGGTGKFQAPRYITNWDNTAKEATVSPDFAVVPDATSLYTIWPAPLAPTAASALPKVLLGDGAHGGAGTTVQLQTPLDATVKAIDNAVISDSAFVQGAEPGGVPAHTAGPLAKLAYVLARLVNRTTLDLTTGAWALRNAANNADLATRTDSNNGTTAVKGKDA